jgi:tetratricopeptide (TPR) repeat protein
MKADFIGEGQDGPYLVDCAESIAARYFMELGLPDKAQAVYGPEYMARNAKNASALSQYAIKWSMQWKNQELALPAAKMVVELTPENYTAYSSLAQILEKLNNYPEALKAAEKAVALAPAQPPVLKSGMQKLVDRIRAAMEKKEI